MSCSANQRTSVKLIVDGIDDKIIPHVFINFSHPTLLAFRNHVMAVVRLHPGEPMYDCETIHIGDREVDEEFLKDILLNITKDLLLRGARAPKIKLIVKGKLPLEQSGKIESTLPKKPALPFTKKTPTKTPLKSSAATTYNIPSFENIMGLESGGSIADNSIEEEVEADESSDAIRLESQGALPDESKISKAPATTSSVMKSVMIPLRRKGSNRSTLLHSVAETRSLNLRNRECNPAALMQSSERPRSLRGTSLRSSTLLTGTQSSAMKRKAVDKNTMLQTVDESAAFNCNDDTTAAVDTPGNLNGTGTADDSTGERIKSKASRPSSMKYTTITPVKRKGSDRATILESNEIADLYKDGMTAAEVSLEYIQNLRSTDQTQPQKTPVKTPIKSRKASHISENKIGENKIDSRSGSARRKGTGIRGGSEFPSFSGFPSEGRPSMGTITSQWEFMRSNFVNNSEEELEWLMVSKRSGAYKHAHKKSEAAEDRYFKALSDIEIFDRQSKYMLNVASIVNPILSAMAERYVILSVDSECSESLLEVSNSQKQLVDFLKEDSARTNSKLNSQLNSDCVLKPSIKKLLTSLSTNLQRVSASRIASNMIDKETIQKEVKDIRMMCLEANKSSDQALQAMEKWTKREKDTDDYQSCMNEEEAIWLEKEKGANSVALALMRSYVPLTISNMSLKDIKKSAINQNGLYTLELINELKSNKLLQWVVMHPIDISFENFLMGEKKQYFENFERLDVVELRALISVIPLKFELDGDGKKAEWRDRFMSRAKYVIAQQTGESVRGGWDVTKGCRAMVKLQGLKTDLVRRPVYFYPTLKQCEDKLTLLDSRQALLDKKQGWLSKAITDTATCKEEYDTLLKEMRDPEVRAYFGADKVIAAKEAAKQDWMTSESNRKALQEEVTRLTRSIADSPVTRIQFAESMDDIRSHLQKQGHSWGGEEILITGPSVTTTDTDIDSLLLSSDTTPQDPLSVNSPTRTTNTTITTTNPSSVLVSTNSPIPLQSSRTCLFLIGGVFDPNPTVERVMRQSAKFVTAEEEAEGRRKEISALKNRNNSIIDIANHSVGDDIDNNINDINGADGETGVLVPDDTASTVENENESINGCTPFNLTANNSPFRDTNSAENCSSATSLQLQIVVPSSAEKNSEPIPDNITPNTRNAVLTSVNPDLISHLNRMFSPQNAQNKQSRPFFVNQSTTSSPTGPSMSGRYPYTASNSPKNSQGHSPKKFASNFSNNSPKNFPISQNENIEWDENRKPDMSPKKVDPGSGSVISFPLGMNVRSSENIYSSQINVEFKGSKSKLLQKLQAQNEMEKDLNSSPKPTTTDVFGTENSPLPPRPEIKMSFLDEIKAKKNKLPTGGTSFLDQIKARNNSHAGSETI